MDKLCLVGRVHLTPTTILSPIVFQEAYMENTFVNSGQLVESHPANTPNLQNILTEMTKFTDYIY